MQLCIYVYMNKNSVEGHTFYDLCIIYLVLITYSVLSMYLFLIQKTPNKEKLREKILIYSNHCNLLHGVAQRTN